MNLDEALDILRKCCENIDIDDNGHERECGKCEVCRAVEACELASDYANDLEPLLRERVEVVDLMSWHGERIVCELCGQAGTRAGRKRGVGDSPIKHTCVLESE